MTVALTGLSSLAGINAIQESDPFATPEQRMGGPVHPYHSQWGEAAKPYSWESLQTPAGSHGPYGLENQLLGDDMWFIEPAGSPEESPQFDYNMPNITRSRAAPSNITSVGAVPSQADAIDLQVSQWENHAINPNTSQQMLYVRQMEAHNDEWQEIWEVNDGNSDVPSTTRQIAYQANGFGVNDAPSNAYHKSNGYGWGSKHQHRRFAVGHLPGNYMWLRPQGRPLFKTMAHPAQPPIGPQSPFYGHDLGDAFAYDTGAVLLDQPEEYIPPPVQNIATRTPRYENPQGTDPMDWW